MWMKLLEWAKVEEIIVTQGNDYQWSFIAEEVSSTYKVDKMISIVSIANFSPCSPCHLLCGPRYRLARVTEMVTTIEIGPCWDFWPSPLLSVHLASSRGQLWALEWLPAPSVQFISVQSLSRVRLFATPRITARQASLSITNSWSSLRLTSIESVMPSSHLILCRPLLLLPPIPPSIRDFSNESALRMRWPKYWSFSFSIIPSKEHPGLITFRMDWLDLPAVQGTLKSLLQHQPLGNQLIP